MPKKKGRGRPPKKKRDTEAEADLEEKEDEEKEEEKDVECNHSAHLADASFADIHAVPGISAKSAELIYNLVQENKAITWDELTKHKGIGEGKITKLGVCFSLDDTNRASLLAPVQKGADAAAHEEHQKAGFYKDKGKGTRRLFNGNLQSPSPSSTPK